MCVINVKIKSLIRKCAMFGKKINKPKIDKTQAQIQEGGGGFPGALREEPGVGALFGYIISKMA